MLYCYDGIFIVFFLTTVIILYLSDYLSLAVTSSIDFEDKLALFQIIPQKYLYLSFA